MSAGHLGNRHRGDRHLGEKHLGDKVAAVADDQLSGRDRESALAHLAGCGACRAAVEAQREVSRRLAGMTRPSAAPDLLERLRVLGLTPDLPTTGHVVHQAAVAGSRLARRRRRPERLLARPVHRGRAVAGVASVLVIATGATYAVGGQHEPGRPVRPPVATFVSQHGTGGGAATLDDPAVSAVTASYHP